MSDEGFLSRWSRRKRAAEAGLPVADPVEQTPPVAIAPAAPPVPGEPPPGEPPFDITTLPAIDSLTMASDFTAFLRKEVPEALKRAALRRAWSLDPAIRDFVGPADYAWDYNAPDGVPGGSLDIVGNVKDLLAQVFGPEPEAGAEDAAVAEAPAADPEPAVAPATEPPAAQVAQAPGPVPAAPEMADDTPAQPPRRHGSALPS